MTLFARPTPPPIASIDLRLCGVAEMLAATRGARLIVADPPWRYSNNPGVANPEETGIYAGLADEEIVSHLDLAFASSAPSARLAVWFTWPKLGEWAAAGWAGSRWGPIVTGGAWTKQIPTTTGARRAQSGVGYHWRGQCEPIGIFTRGATGRPSFDLDNAAIEPPGSHSEKPVGWLRAMVRAWTDPGDLVVDMYAGLAPLARACLAEGRRYVGAEIDPERHADAMDALHLYWSRTT